MRIKQSTFAAFIDFRKAYDSVSRDHLWTKLSRLGLPFQSKVHTALRNLYENIKCNVRVNESSTAWFNVPIGLQQGCVLSSLLFNLYINDLVINLKQLCPGIPIGGENVVSLMYADDLVLLARNERDLQHMLEVVNQWCSVWNVTLNSDKSQIVHFRPSELYKV